MVDKAKIRDLRTKIEALVIAIPREQDAFEFYTDMAENSDEKSTKDIFLFLANQEKSHKEQLEKLLEHFQEHLDEEFNKKP